jgi:hypothetical protein
MGEQRSPTPDGVQVAVRQNAAALPDPRRQAATTASTLARTPDGARKRARAPSGVCEIAIVVFGFS